MWQAWDIGKGVSNPCGRRGISARAPWGIPPGGAKSVWQAEGGGKSVWLTCDFGHMGPCARKQSPGTCECLAL